MDKLAATEPIRTPAVRTGVVAAANALLARAHGDEAGYRDYADRYRRMATFASLWKGQMALAQAMT